MCFPNPAFNDPQINCIENLPIHRMYRSCTLPNKSHSRKLHYLHLIGNKINIGYGQCRTDTSKQNYYLFLHFRKPAFPSFSFNFPLYTNNALYFIFFSASLSKKNARDLRGKICNF